MSKEQEKGLLLLTGMERETAKRCVQIALDVLGEVVSEPLDPMEIGWRQAAKLIAQKIRYTFNLPDEAGRP